MNANDARAVARSRAQRRLRRMTIGTALLGIAATGGLGWTAALSYNGSTTSTAATAGVITADAGSTSTSTSTTTSSASSSASATTAPTVTSVIGNAHASTGGS
jgi:type VI protein secretion system component VasK